jgi:hypothetical protein
MARYQKPTDKYQEAFGGIKILNRKEGEKRAGNTSNRSFKLHPLSLNTWRCLILHINSNLTWPN